MISYDTSSDIEQAAETAKYALSLARRHLECHYEDEGFTTADCIALAGLIITKLNMMHDCDMRYVEQDREDRRACRK